MASFMGISTEPMGYPTAFGLNVLSPNIIGYNPVEQRTIISTDPVIEKRSILRTPGLVDDFGFPVLIQTNGGLQYGMNSGTITNYYNYLDVNQDPDLRNKIVRYFKERTLHWLLNDEEFKQLLNYFVFRTDSKRVQYVDPVRKHSEMAKENNDTSEQLRAKVKYMKEFVVSKRLIAKILEKYGTKFNVKWWNFKNNIEDIKDVIHHELKKKIKNNMQFDD